MASPSEGARQQLARRQEQGLQEPAVAPQRSKDTPPAIEMLLKNRDLGEWQRALPAGLISAERFTRVALTAMRKDPKLLECDPYSVIAALTVVAQLGLEVNSPLQHAYLIPFKNKGVLECQLVIGYRGYITLAHRSGQVLSIDAQPVLKGDRFKITRGANADLIHEPDWEKDTEEAIAYYAIAKYPAGGYNFVVMSRAKVQAHRMQFSKQPYGFGWKDHFDAMALKGLALDTPIPTPYGFTNMGDLEPGDSVFDMDGQPVRVLATSEVKHLGCYRVTFGDGTSIVCDDEHIWWTTIGQQNYRQPKPRTIVEMHDAKALGLQVTVPVAAGLDLPEMDLPVHPYILGMWLGDGTSANATITSSLTDLDDTLANLRAAGATVGTVRRDPRNDSVSIGLHGLRKPLADLGVLGNKHVPPVYLRASFTQRLDLLRGLMDSDGTTDGRNRATFVNTNLALADAVAELACSLGETVTRAQREAEGFGRTVLVHSVQWTPAIAPFRLSRKSVRTPGRRVPAYRVVKSIEPIPSVPTKCIYVGSPTASYLAGERMVPTHNTCIRQLPKVMPMTPEFAQAVSLDERTFRSTRDPDTGILSAEPTDLALDAAPPDPDAHDPLADEARSTYDPSQEPAGFDAWQPKEDQQ